MRKSGFLAMNEQGAVTYHCVSRVVDRDYKFGDEEKAVFVKMMRQYEQFQMAGTQMAGTDPL